MPEPVYKIRYSVQDWNKSREGKGKQVAPGISVMEGDYGYTDELFLASIIHDDNGCIGSILLMSSKDGCEPSRALLEAVRGQIDHHLKHHTP